MFTSVCVCLQNLKSVGLQTEASVTDVSAVSTCCLHVAYMHQVAVSVDCCRCPYLVNSDCLCSKCPYAIDACCMLWLLVCCQC